MKADKVCRNSIREWLSHWGKGANWSDPTGATVPTAKTTIRDLLDDADAMEETLREIRSRLNGGGPIALQIHRLIDNALASTTASCRGCGQPLSSFNFDKVADGCPCNSLRGVNHGLVPKDTCTCIECDPAQTGSVRKA